MTRTGRRRRLSLVGAALVASAALSGCSVVGEVFVTADGTRVDLLVQHPRQTQNMQVCGSESPGMGVDLLMVEADHPDDVACRLTGTVRGEGWSESLLTVTQDYVFLAVPAGYFGWTNDDGVPDPRPSFDVTVHFPGQVLAVDDAGRQLAGNAVRWNDYPALNRRGLGATARIGPAPVTWPVPAVLGLVLGGTLTAGALWVERRLTARTALDEPLKPPSLTLGVLPDLPLEPEPEQPTRPPPPEDPQVWSRP